MLAAKLRPSDIDASAGSVEEIERIVRQIRARWPHVRILLRADSGFAREALMAWCEENRVDYVFGLARNGRLVAMIEAELAAAQAMAEKTGHPARRFKDFHWSTLDSWSRRRRVIAKAEWTQGEANPRFVVTSLKRAEAGARHLYEDIYCARGEMENRIKECQLDLYADRTSTATMRANQLRLWFASMAYVLICALRRIGLAETAFADATCGTIRLKLLKIGALVRITVRRIKFAMASACPAARRLGPRRPPPGRRRQGPCLARLTRAAAARQLAASPIGPRRYAKTKSPPAPSAPPFRTASPTDHQNRGNPRQLKPRCEKCGLALFRRLDVAEGGQQGHVVDDLEHAADDQRQSGERRGQQHAGDIAGLIAEARLRGTAVTLAAAARSGGVTTAMT